jgi:DNA polymerase III delta subunit
MRHVLAPIKEEPEDEGEWIIAAAETVINSIFAEKRLTNVTTEKAWESSWAKTEPFKAPKIL